MKNLDLQTDKDSETAQHPTVKRVTTMEGAENVPPTEVAFIHICKAVGLTHSEIGGLFDRSRHDVGHVLQRSNARVENGEDPLEVFADILAPVLALDPDVGGDV